MLKLNYKELELLVEALTCMTAHRPDTFTELKTATADLKNKLEGEMRGRKKIGMHYLTETADFYGFEVPNDQKV